MRVHRTLIGFFVALVLCHSVVIAQYKYTPPEKLSDGIRVGTLEDAGLDEAKITAATEEILKGTYPNIHSLLIFRKGRLVYENYFTGEDRERGVGPLGMVKHTRGTLHDMRSVTKTVVALAVLHAATKGKIKSLDEPIFDIFPEYKRHADGDKKNITIRHLLTMSAGLEWDEKISYTDPKNSEYRMDDAPDPIGFVLQQKLVSPPGTAFNYSGGLTQILAEIVKRKTGLPVDEYTGKNIFAPLGISAFKWVKINNTWPSAASGLRLRSRDMAKIGLLVMNNGKWNGKRIISPSLIAEATRKHFDLKDDFNDKLISNGYGYQMWHDGYRVGGRPVNVIYFSGNGGQVLSIDRENDIMTVVTAGNYNRRGLKHASWEIYPDLVFPAIIEPKANAAK